MVDRDTSKRNGRAKLTAIQADLIREAYANKSTTQRKLAEKYGVSQMAIWQIIQKKTWKKGDEPK